MLKKIKFLLLCFTLVFLFFHINFLNAQQPVQGTPESSAPVSTPGEAVSKIPENLSLSPEVKENLLKEVLEKGKGKEGLGKEAEEKLKKDEKEAEEEALKKKSGEEKSELEKIFAGEIPTTVSTRLTQFGYNIFTSPVSTFAPVTDVPVGPDYIIGPEDSFTIILWGRFEASYPVVVNRNGEINLPKIGNIKVWGLTFEEMRNLLQNQFSKYYIDFKMNITMNKLRTILVYVVGEVKTPGSYSLSSLSTAYNALFASGGPTKKGTLRNIQVLRNGEVLQKIDLYEFLLKGNKSHDQKLQSGDTIFVPIIGPVVGIAGNVKRPALYEYKDNFSLKDLIETAGGITPFGYLNRVQVERVVAHEKKIVTDLNLSGIEDFETNSLLKELLQDGDLVKVYPIFTAIQEIVYLEGNIKRPGGYELKKGMHLNDLIKSFDDLLSETYLPHGSITRMVPPDFHSETIAFNLGKLLGGDLSQNFELQSQDKVKIYSKNEMQELPKVKITGTVGKPGDYIFLEKMRVKDLIFLAGNFQRNAYLPSAELTRIIKFEDKTSTKHIYIDLREALKENPEHNIPLEPDDHLTVRNIPDWVLDNTVTLKGEVRFPGIYTIAKGEHLSSVLERAGGYADKAFIKGAFFTRESEKIKIKERIDDFVTKLEQEVLQESVPGESPNALLGAGQSEELLMRKEFLTLKTELIRKMREAKIEGRILIKLDSLEKFKNSIYDVELEKNDTLFIPPVPSSVSVLGEVYNPNSSILYAKGVTIGDYLNRVGGTNKNANESEIYLIRADGTTISRLQGRSWNTEGYGWFTPSFMNIKAEPGDTILVPKRVIIFDYLKYADQVTRTIANLATTVAVVFGVLQY